MLSIASAFVKTAERTLEAHTISRNVHIGAPGGICRKDKVTQEWLTLENPDKRFCNSQAHNSEGESEYDKTNTPI
jgi:hypothetical protein